MLQILGLVLVLIGILYVMGAAVFAIWADHEERKQEAERERFEQILRANTPRRDWPTRKGPHGFDRNRNGRRIAS